MVIACEESVLKADPADQQRLLDVQQVDTDLDRIAHRRASLPEEQRVQELSTRDRALAGEITTAEVEVSDLQLEQRKADNDVELVRERSAKDSALLDSGSITDPKQLTSLQNEIASLARRQAELEDIEIEVMERLENAEHHLRDLRHQRETLAEDMRQAASARDAVVAELAESEAALRADRGHLMAQVPAELLGLYDRLRADYGGIGAARLHQGRCEGCRIELTPVDISRIREAAPEEVLRCEECRRLLIRTPESGL